MTSPLALTVLGLAIIVVTVGLLLKGKTHPIVAMTLIPIVGAILTGAGVAEISDFYLDGLDRVMKVVVMFIFAIIYFGILSDVGLFEPVIKALIRATRGKPILVTLGTAAIAIVAHLDGSGPQHSCSPSPRCCRSTRRCVCRATSCSRSSLCRRR